VTAIENFVIDKMSGYVVGGMKPETAAKFTRGELSAIYKGDHWGRDAAGKPQKTHRDRNKTIFCKKRGQRSGSIHNRHATNSGVME
jgi:hypothetical protein